MFARRARFAGLVAAVSTPVYVVIQLVVGADAGDSVIRGLWFLLIVFLVSLAIDPNKKKQAPEETETPPEETSSNRP